MTIKAIETKYKGYRFRSRLEARWAVFFDNCGAKYLYENEGYQLPHGWYLPDFFLPEEDIFVEIKPDISQISDRVRTFTLAGELLAASGKSVYVFHGDPVDALGPNFPGMFLMEATKDIGSIPSFFYLSDYKSAAIKARQSRFEHGEVGA
jgi:hypothetical protein